jgi:ankyrin repeat protein
VITVIYLLFFFFLGLSCCRVISIVDFCFDSREINKQKRKKDMQESKELVDACYYERWEEAEVMITKNPLLACTGRDEYGYTPAIWAVRCANVDFLQHMLDAILFLSLQQHHQHQPQVQKEEEQRMLRDAFERGTDNGWTPAHGAAAGGSVECLAFLVEHTPSGEAVLEVKDKHGETPAHCATSNENVDALDFIARNAPSRNEPRGFPSSGLQIPDTKQRNIKAIMMSSSESQRCIGDLQNFP